MQFVEYGKEHSGVIVLLHGGGLSWWNYRETAEALASEYHVVLPVLAGHTGSGSDFTTIEAQAEELIRWIDRQFGGSVLLLGGVSLGGQVLLEILSQRQDICRYAWIESAVVVPSPVTCALIPAAVGSCWGLIRRRWFAKWQFRWLRIQPKLFEEYYRDTCGISRANLTAVLLANASYSLKPAVENCSAKAYVVVGEKEHGSVLQSAERIHSCLRESVLQVIPYLHHGEFSLNHAEDCADRMRELMRE